MSRAAVARLAKQVRAVVRRVRRLEGHRRRIGFRIRHDVIDTVAEGWLEDQDEGDESA